MATALNFRLVRRSCLPQLASLCRSLACLVALAPTTALGQFATVINAPPNPLPSVVNSDTQINMSAGATWQVINDGRIHSGAADGSSSNIEINVAGGTIRNSLEMHAGTTLNFSGGESNAYFYGHQGSVANISGGKARIFYANSGAVANVSGGVLEGQSHFLSGSTVNISGGLVGNRHFDSLTVDFGATANISGGAVGVGFNLYGGVANVTGGSIYDGMDIGSGSSLKLFGEDFRIDGVPVAGLDAIGSSLQVDVPSQSTLSGVYSDGTPFVFIMPYNMIDNGTISLHRTAVAPATPGTFTLPGATLPTGIRDGQRIVVGAGAVMPDYYTAGRGSQVEVQAGGALGEGFKAVGAVVDVYGNLAPQSMYVTDGGILNLRDGQALDSTSYIEVYRGSEMNVSGGDWGHALSLIHI